MPVVLKGHPAIPEAPSDGASIWRFMSLSKFLSMLATRTLYFTQAKILSMRDPFEGCFAGIDHEFARRIQDDEEYARKYFGAQYNDGLRGVLGSDHLKLIESVVQQMFYVNCWSESEFESAALWSVYASENEGIAIRSTTERLRRALTDAPQQIYIGRVEYKDYRADGIGSGNLFRPIYAKRKSYAFEAEVRASISQLPNKAPISEHIALNPAGLAVPCDVALLIERIFVAPFSPTWFAEAVTDVAGKYGLSCRVTRSSITERSLT